MIIKSDACSLINMQYIGIIPLLVELIGDIVITEEVFKESIEIGLKRKKAVAEDLQQHHKSGLIRKVINHGLIPPNLGRGEAETIAETHDERNRGEKVLCITEDKKAKREAIRLNLEVLGVDSLLVELCIRGALTEDDFDQKILLLDKYHKLDLIRITELRRFIRVMKSKGGGEK